MRRDRRVPLLVLTILCVSAEGPSVARATVRFFTPPGATIEETQAGPDVFTAGGIEKECDQVEFKGTLLDRSRALELAPLYGKCEAKSLNGLPAKMVWWGCGYVLHPFAKTSRGEAWRAKVDIACPGAHEIEWNVYESAAKYRAAATVCVTSMPPQRADGIAELSNAKGSPGEIAVHWKLSGIEYEAFGSSLFCGLPPDTSKSDATYTSRAIIGATDLTGHPLAFRLSD